ncbi:MAG: ATP-binding cassette domain-containing protein, partial [Varibaculum cambriense]|nr:ATP-binding cassette domain-containing protein [Varibaculum cambriense]
MDTLLRLKHVSFSRGGNPILQDVSFKTKLGENWVILGPNGAGKTTLVSILAARSYPSSGKAKVLGERLGAVPVQELHERVGLCSTAALRVIPRSQTVKALILSAAYGTMVRGRDQDFEDIDYQRRTNLMELFGVAA